MENKISKTDLFLNLAQPDEMGISRWVKITEFTGEYAPLQLGNGGSWCRRNSILARRYNVEFCRSLSPGNRIDAIRLNGFNEEQMFNQTIRKDIWDEIRKRKCVMLGFGGSSDNPIEVDHKNGRKNDLRVSDQSTQELDDFQPLCRAANIIKRQICKKCKETDKRWDAKNLLGNLYSFYEGDENYTEELGCIGCYQYDPVMYRKRSYYIISKETKEFILKKIYPDLDISEIEKDFKK